MKSQVVAHAADFKTGDLKLKGVKVYEIVPGINTIPSYSRRDFYKVCMVTGKNIIHYADRSFETNGPILFFGNPRIPYSWEIFAAERNGLFCVFTEEFLKSHDRSDSLQQSPLFRIGGTPIFFLDKEQEKFIRTIFTKMLAELDTDYIYKDDLVRNYINLIIHEAMKMQPSDNFVQHKNASSRITSLFLDLLERQFPIDNPEQKLQLRNPQDFAKHLSIHINHLNRSVKEVTGKPTSVHIAERVISEAKALLQHTDWNIAEIAYGLGFEYPTYFNNYFKRMTGNTPKALRV